jgi:uncharacterized protein YcsI (UPF0317 family)
VQCNVVILPSSDAAGFGAWCEANPAIAPVLARSQPGDPHLPTLGDVDVRTDLPAYRRLADGAFVEEVADLGAWWADDLVAFAFGCSFSLEEALLGDGVALDYAARGFGGATYVTSVQSVTRGAYAGPVVVSMRPLPAASVERAVAVSRRLPALHGAPIHVGDPARIGVDLDAPLDQIGPISVAPGEVPVFWACGVTTQLVLERARPTRGFTHVSARMLVCDLRIADLDAIAVDSELEAG